MLVATLNIDELEIPSDIFTLEGFRNWFGALGESAPRASFCGGTVYLEMTPQNYESHAPLTTEVNAVLRILTRKQQLGVYFAAPSWFTHSDANVSTEPDGFLVTNASLEAGLIRINPVRKHEMVGRPDMVFEAVSKTSHEKDLHVLLSRYAAAGVPEYWIADARQPQLVFRVLVLEGDAYHDQEPDGDGWLASPAFGRAFRLKRTQIPSGLGDFELEVRERQ